MSGLLLLGAWLATVWIHATVLAIAALALSHWAGIKRCELRDAAWKTALIGGILTGSLPFLMPGVGWWKIALPPAAVSERISAMSAVESPLPLDGEDLKPSPAVALTQAAEPKTRSVEVPSTRAVIQLVFLLLSVSFAVGVTIGLLRIVMAMRYIQQLTRRSEICRRDDVLETLERLRSELNVSSRVQLLVSPDIAGAMATGYLRPQIIVPAVALEGHLDAQQLEGLLAHELAHHKRRDPLWSLVGHLASHAFWFQPLIHLIRRNLRMDAELLADALACRALCGGLDLARCLATMAEWLIAPSEPRAEIGSVHLFARRASLKQRVESLLAGNVRLAPPTLVRRLLVRTAIVGTLLLLIAGAPAVFTETPLPSQSGDTEVNRTLAAVTLAAALAASPAVADEPKAGQQESRETAAELKVPESVHGFSGEILGTIVSKDTDGARLVIKVQKVTNVWKGNKAEKPRDLVGRTVPVEKFFGRFLDVLLVVKPGDTVMLEAKHVRGDQLQFLGEVFRKVEPDSQDGESSAAGRDRPARPDVPKPDSESKSAKDDGPFPTGLRGFRGILVGKVLKTDVEKGVLVFEPESVKRTWPKNQATNPASSKGKEITVNGIAGKWLDVLLVLKPGDRIEVEAFHNRGEALDFVQEWLKKVD